MTGSVGASVEILHFQDHAGDLIFQSFLRRLKIAVEQFFNTVYTVNNSIAVSEHGFRYVLDASIVLKILMQRLHVACAVLSVMLY